MLQEPYPYEKAKLIVWEMAELLALDLVEQKKVTDQIVLTVGYDVENLANPETAGQYQGEVTTDRYGRKTPKHAHGTENIGKQTSSTRLIVDAAMKLFERIIDRRLTVRRVTIAACHVVDEDSIKETEAYLQMDLFTDYEALEKQREQEETALRKERALQEAALKLKKKYGKNAVLRGKNLEDGGTTISRNRQIGGHGA